MARTWLLWIGLILLWACVCAGMEEYAEPVTEEANGGEAAPAVVDPGSAGGYEVIEPKPEGDTYVTDSGAGGEGEVVEPRPEGDLEVITSKPEGDDQVVATDVGDVEIIDPKSEGQGGRVDGALPGDTLEVVVEPGSDGEGSVGPAPDGEYRIYALTPAGNNEPTDSAPEADYRILGMVPTGGNGPVLAQLVADVMASVGMPPQNSDWAGLQANTPPGWASVPELAQMRSAIGLDMTTQMAAMNEAIHNVPSLAGQLDNVISQFSQSARETFDAFPIPGIVNLPTGR